DNLYAGEQVDLARVDLGKYLDAVLQVRKPAPRVTLVLYTTAAPRPSSPLRVRGFDLVLQFVRLNPKAEPPTLHAGPAFAKADDAFLDVEDGSLVISEGKLSLSGLKPAALPARLVRVRGGSLFLSKVRLSGPMGADAGRYQALIDFQGGGDEAME